MLLTTASAFAADQPAPAQPPSTFDELKDAVLNGKPLGPTTVKGYWYDYTADAVSMHYGNEYDVLIWQNFLTHYNVGFGFFDYKADQFLTDTRKISVMFQVKF